MPEIILDLSWLMAFVFLALFTTYHRINLLISTIALSVLTYSYTFFGDGGLLWNSLLWIIVGILIALNIIPLRRSKLTRPLINIYRKMVPKMSSTEKEALEAGNVWWDGELFSGMPNWEILMSMPPPKLSAEEQSFLDGPCNELCMMLDDWEVSHELGDLPERIWDYIKTHKFFAMIIPKEFGGLEFSSYANAMVITKLASRSAVASSTVGVPNSLGPAELLLHYGTDEQKNRYLPGLASGEEIPCFALTSTEAGSDASALIDSGKLPTKV